MDLLNNFNGISLVAIMVLSYCAVLKNKYEDCERYARKINIMIIRNIREKLIQGVRRKGAGARGGGQLAADVARRRRPAAPLHESLN